ncbi:hypothetical protein DL89DRAFT_153188 [Linderina pennispora]|uniref:Uncharacterized protein n=1 Tax=Linderina pennispora TaxID=61395 RepID=A0A1Y1W9E5_9FUNG|nr:uncharacterized protein DL89DRAFT_153188 [Linderina pennispora]ORX70160.1 hypothetical protein DL89DRAFT_153188 [Linderina pennispora]
MLQDQGKGHVRERAVLHRVFASADLTKQLLRDVGRLLAVTRDHRLADLWRALCHTYVTSETQHAFDEATGGIGEAFGESSGSLRAMWRVVVRARQSPQEEMAAAWLAVFATASDAFPGSLLANLFGIASNRGLETQQVVAREMALDVAAFFTAPFAAASAARAQVLQSL